VKGQITYNSGLSTKYFYIGSANSLTDTYYLDRILYLENGMTRDRNYINRLLRDVYFLKDYGKASSRGVGNLWAEINYNF